MVYLGERDGCSEYGSKIGYRYGKREMTHVVVSEYNTGAVLLDLHIAQQMTDEQARERAIYLGADPLKHLITIHRD